ncbi:lebercilin [Hippocampus zosterae]|uniref:lebercilin n=1 Tax=Hippocampus zosterae TaxID=109293 RepID=UPI00223CF76F|nr:lebercilin [Hippocampus zosterae]
MESKCNASEDDWDDNRSRRSLGIRKSRAASASKKHKRSKNYRDRIRDEKLPSRTEIYPADPQRASDDEGRRSKGASYSDDYDNDSERSLSPFAPDPTLSPTPPARANLISSSSPYNTGMEKRVRSRPPRPGRSRATRSHSKESLPPRDLDPLTRQMLSGRLLKINELRNVHGELQLRIAELQKENRILKQLHTRQEKALQNYTDAESKISQMLSCHANETHVLRERLRRTRERERAAERRLKEKEEQLLRSHATVGRMKKLVEQRELGAREELSCKLDQERARTHEAELKIKELERNMELMNGSHHRQLAAERKKTLAAQEDVRSLQKELEQLANKLREKERELESRNIYAHRVGKASPRRAADGEPKHKVCSRTHSKAVQTHECGGGSPDFPSPPPALVEDNEPAPDGYLSLKQADAVDSGAKPKREHPKKTGQDPRDSSEAKEPEGERQANTPDGLDVTAKLFGADWQKEKEEVETGGFLTNPRKSVRAQEEAHRRCNRRDAGGDASGDAGEARRRKDQLLAKMREIDLQNQEARNPVFVDSSDSNAAASSSAAEPSPSPPTARRRSLCSPKSADDWIFAGYAPSLGKPRQSAAGGEDGDHALEAIGVFSLKGAETAEKNKKSSLMQQLFGSLATPLGETRTAELPDGAAGGGARGNSRAAGRLGLGPPAASLSARHVVDSRPAVRVIPSFDDDIEELTL